MANPQVENGFVMISSEIFDALCRLRIPGEARQVLDFIIRKTYGYHKKEDCISLNQFVEGTGLSKITIVKARKKLIEMNLITITQKGDKNCLIYSFQKDYEKWKSLPKKVTLPKKVINVTQKGNENCLIYSFQKDYEKLKPLPNEINVTQKGNKSLPKKVTTKYNNKYKEKKQAPSSLVSSPSPEEIFFEKDVPEKNINKECPDYIDRIIDTFAQVHGDYYVLNRGKERKAAGKLLNFFKQIYPDDDKEKMLGHLRAFFEKCMNIEDPWYRNNMSIPLMVSKYNEINQILKYGPNGYIKNENPLKLSKKVIAGKTCEWDRIEGKWCFADGGRWWYWNEERQEFWADKLTRWRE